MEKLLDGSKTEWSGDQEHWVIDLFYAIPEILTLSNYSILKLKKGFSLEEIHTIFSSYSEQNENFNLDNYKNESYTIKRLENNIVLSNFYKLPKRLVSKFKEYLNSISEEAEFRISFTNFIDGLKDEEENKKEIKGMIGISGFKSSNGDFLYM
jgi:DNA-binding transcriptional MerR regulator